MSRKSTPDIMGAVLTATPETWDGKEIDYPLARIKVGQRMRPLAPAEVEAMAESLRQIGLLNAIHLLPDGTLVAGNHRRAAAELLGWTHIRARIVELNEIDAELAEIDENLRRSNLSILEEAEHLLRREELLEAKGARAKPGDNQHTAGDGGGATVAPPPATTAGMAKGAGLSERSAQMRLQIARNLDSEAKAAIRGTDLASSTTQLVELARQPAERQRTIAAMLARHQADSVPHAVALLDLDAGVIDLVCCTDALRTNTSALRALARLPADQQRPVVEMLATGRAATITDAVASLAPPAAPADLVWNPPAQNQPTYAQVYELEDVVRATFKRYYVSYETRYACSDMRACAKSRDGGGFWRACERGMPADIGEWRRGDLAQAINNVASQMEAQQPATTPAEVFAPNGTSRPAPQPAPQKPAAWDGITAHTWDGYADWTAEDDAEYDALSPIWQQPAATLNSVSESRRITRWRVAARLASERRDNLAFSLQESARHLMRAERYAADDAWRADIASRQAAADEAERQAAAETDPWAVAVNSPGSRQQRAQALASALQPWIREYTDEYGRTWRDIENPAHTNGVFWRNIIAEANRRSIRAINEDIWKFAIKQAFAWMVANEPSKAADGATVTPDADGKLLVDWTDDDWAAHAERSQTEPALEFVAGDPKPVRPGTIGGPDTYLPARLAPVSQRDDYDGDEWYTPAEYVDAARRVMGSIDLDPASCDLAQTVVQAGTYLTKEKNGLRSSHWQHQNIWLNPPYSDPARWIEKLLAEYDRGTYVQQAVVLVNNATETAWFQALLARNFSVCLLSRRVAFWRHDQAGVTARQGQAIFYLGPNIGAFINEFEAFGPIVRRVE